MMVGKRSLHSRSYTRKSKKRTKFFAVLGIFIFLLLCVGSWWVTYKSPLVLKGIDISGNNNVSAQEVRALAQEKLEDPLLFWSRNNFLLAPRENIARAVREKFEWVRSVEVEVRGVSRLLVQIQEYEPSYMACGIQSGECFFTDDTGYIYARGLYAFNSPYLVFHVELPEEIIGTRIAPKEEFEKVTGFARGLKDNDLKVREITLLGAGETRLTLAQGTDIVIDRKENTEEMLGNFLLLLTRETLRTGSREAFLSATEYIDVRYGNKVFYKARE